MVRRLASQAARPQSKNAADEKKTIESHRLKPEDRVSAANPIAIVNSVLVCVSGLFRKSGQLRRRKPEMETRVSRPVSGGSQTIKPTLVLVVGESLESRGDVVDRSEHGNEEQSPENGFHDVILS